MKFGNYLISTITLATSFDSLVTADDTADYDFIVVGAGPGGGTVASRLALAGHETLLIDAGGDYGEHPFVSTPLFHLVSTIVPEIEWKFYVDNGEKKNVLYPRASGLGGCALHNALISLTPHDEDFNNLASLTKDYRFKMFNMRRLFKKLENNQYTDGNQPGHGYDGYFDTSLLDARLLENYPDAQLASFLQAIYANFEVHPTQDVNGLDKYGKSANRAEGIHPIPTAVDKVSGQSRSGVYHLIKDTLSKTDKLTIMTDTFVTKVEMDSTKRALGVWTTKCRSVYEAAQDGEHSCGDATLIRVKEEVIVSGGAFNTPQILMLSGIGDKEELEEHNIDVVHHLPGVGKNLHDRLEGSVNFEMNEEWKLLQGCAFNPDASIDPCFKQYIGHDPVKIYGTNGILLGIQSKSSPERESPDIYVLAAPLFFRGYVDGWVGEALASLNQMTLLVLKAHSYNRSGFVKLKSDDPFATPSIDFNGFDDRDVSIVANKIQELRDFGKIEAVSKLVANELIPGPNVTTAEELTENVKQYGFGHHACCSAKIGANDDPMAVLDGQLRVRGVKGLRVVDASAFPDIPGFFIVVPIQMLAEKAAEDIILEYLVKEKFPWYWVLFGCGTTVGLVGIGKLSSFQKRKRASEQEIVSSNPMSEENVENKAMKEEL